MSLNKAAEVAAENLYPGLFSLSDERYSIDFDNNAEYRPEHQALAKEEALGMLKAALPHLLPDRKELAQRLSAAIDEATYGDGSVNSGHVADRVVAHLREHWSDNE